MYSCQIEGKTAMDTIKKKSMFSEEVINSKIDELVENGLLIFFQCFLYF